jgi:hypothetical protein
MEIDGRPTGVICTDTLLGGPQTPPHNRTFGTRRLCQGTDPISTLILNYGLGIWSIFHNGYTIHDACTLSRIQH